jgi:hypothetical protein
VFHIPAMNHRKYFVIMAAYLGPTEGVKWGEVTLGKGL